MCLICADFQKQKMTLGEAKRAFGEMAADLDPEHRDEVREMLARAEQEENDGDDD